MAVDLPVLPLALHAAVVHLLARAADLVLQGVALGGLAAVAVLLSQAICIWLFRGSFFFDLLKPWKRSIVLPGVEVGDRITLDLLVWALFRTEFVDKVVLLFFFEDVEATVKVLLNKFSGHSCLLLELIIFGFLSLATYLSESPKTSVSKQRSQINFDCLQEVLVVEAEHAVEQVLQVDPEHPDLLVVEEAARLVIKSVFSEGGTKVILDFVDAGIMHIKYLCLLALVSCVNIKFLLSQKTWSQDLKVSLEVLDGIIKESSSIRDALE